MPLFLTLASSHREGRSSQGIAFVAKLTFGGALIPPRELSHCKSNLVTTPEPPRQSHHALRPVFLHIFGRMGDEEDSGSMQTPGIWEPFHQMPDVWQRQLPWKTTTTATNSNHSKKGSHSSHSIRCSTKSKALGVTTTFCSTLQFSPSVSSWACLHCKFVKLMHCFVFKTEALVPDTEESPQQHSENTGNF